jgi:cyanophycinase
MRLAAFLFVVCWLLGIGAPRSAAQHAKGYLYIVGDGAETPEIMQRFVALAGGANRASIVILPMASSLPDTAGTRHVALLQALGVRRARYLVFSRQRAMEAPFADTLSEATGVFFTGGDQSRLADVLVGTPVQHKLMDLWRNGAVIGGGSAGAAIMSKVMITGDELLQTDTTVSFVSIWRDNIKTAEGLGFMDDAIIDQHFIRRKRHNRLISLVLEHPQLVGIGIDEKTAIVVAPDHSFEVVGKSSVVVYDARTASPIRSGPAHTIGGANIRMHVLLAGDRYDLATGAVTPAESSR